VSFGRFFICFSLIWLLGVTNVVFVCFCFKDVGVMSLHIPSHITRKRGILGALNWEGGGYGIMGGMGLGIKLDWGGVRGRWRRGGEWGRR
jgi:hypothetical protein